VIVSVDPDGQVLTLTSGTQSYRFHAMWLRDNAQDPDTRATGNGQRLIALRDIPRDTHIAAAEGNGDQITLRFEPEGKSISYSADWLITHAYDRSRDTQRGWLAPDVTLWDASASDQAPWGDFAALKQGGDALADWLDGAVRYGFAKIGNGPIEDGALFQVVDLFGYVRETNYGRHFEVRTEVNPTNLAFTGLGLQAHTDYPYRDPVPSVQVLYCLESTAAGGENMIVDGFACARRLQQENPAYFDVLADHCAPFEYAGDAQTCLQSRRPMIELSPDGELIAVRFNNRSLGAVTDVPFDKMDLWYAAYRRLGEIIDDPAMEISFRLDPGQAFIVDNTRVLHARKAYSGTGTRWLQGCYADKDGLRSARLTVRQTQEVAAQ
jgi:gamma-butyrobetaine dioxygenase